MPMEKIDFYRSITLAYTVNMIYAFAIIQCNYRDALLFKNIARVKKLRAIV